eukprot:TRINITY_DN66887_c0_g1_i1.p1 TRINITY_DN66887_c0_g1~~TRINITY_DN66887_c0_g1_i1.p1  ORF type:complete len:102 (-),score=14.34 TRINITY_DN66887_c0_g1_i1:309-614(-)
MSFNLVTKLSTGVPHRLQAIPPPGCNSREVQASLLMPLAGQQERGMQDSKQFSHMCKERRFECWLCTEVVAATCWEKSLSWAEDAVQHHPHQSPWVLKLSA